MQLVLCCKFPFHHPIFHPYIYHSSCLSLVFYWEVKCIRHSSGWGNIMSGCSSTLYPPSAPKVLIPYTTFRFFVTKHVWLLHFSDFLKVHHLLKGLSTHSYFSRIQKAQDSQVWLRVLFLYLVWLDNLSLCQCEQCPIHGTTKGHKGWAEH